ncbi:hypothetical protein LY28_02918 [Ruminiclostridium sufflavum DSM 19573]|uniref:Uncharacterized protein n=1 Tax=Ruminiclostridium sufflavum DSM 19573 TaxID=1121337 RepID=A0A318XUM7_9FIRM|nr:hypothetical protein LY28_02918 [Ruminiclostridium sufflavum DSM 19573]
MGSAKQTDKEWVEQQRMCGKTLKAWCEENDINLSTMSDRISKLKNRTYSKEKLISA